MGANELRIVAAEERAVAAEAQAEERNSVLVGLDARFAEWCVSQERVDPEGGAGKNRLGSMGFQVAKTVAQVEVLSVLRELRTLQRKD